VHRNPPFAPPFAPNRDTAPPEVQIALVEPAKLGDAQAAAVEQLQNSVVAKPHGILEVFGTAAPDGAYGPDGRVEQGVQLAPVEDTR
jgi:hypothetical protein